MKFNFKLRNCSKKAPGLKSMWTQLGFESKRISATPRIYKLLCIGQESE